MLRVIDTSDWKSDIIYTNVDIDAIYTKATEGTYYVDPSCDPIVQWAIGRGKKWGVFHFATNQLTSAEAEADYFVDNCLGYIGSGILILDNEAYSYSAGTVANVPTDVGWANAWLNRVLARTGVKPLIYMSLYVIQSVDWQPVINDGFGLICADYVDDNTPIPNFGMDSNRDPNPRWDGVVNDVMWQFTSTGQLDGYGGNLDCDFFYGDAHAWDLYAAVAPPGPVPPPTPVPTPVPVPTPTPVPPPTPVPTPVPVPTPTPTPVPKPKPKPVPKPTPRPVVHWYDFIVNFFKAILDLG